MGSLPLTIVGSWESWQWLKVVGLLQLGPNDLWFNRGNPFPNTKSPCWDGWDLYMWSSGENATYTLVVNHGKHGNVRGVPASYV